MLDDNATVKTATFFQLLMLLDSDSAASRAQDPGFRFVCFSAWQARPSGVRCPPNSSMTWVLESSYIQNPQSRNGLIVKSTFFWKLAELRFFAGFCSKRSFECGRSKIGNSYAKKDIEEWQPRLRQNQSLENLQKNQNIQRNERNGRRTEHWVALQAESGTRSFEAKRPKSTVLWLWSCRCDLGVSKAGDLHLRD